MREITRLWRTLDAAPVLAGVEAQWREWLEPDLEAARPFLRPESELAAAYPCPNGGGENCPRRVVVHGADDIVAACGNSPPECDALRLKRADLLVYELDVGALAKEIARILELDDASGELVDGVHGVRALGTVAISPARRVPAFLVLQSRSEDGQHSVERLLARHPATPLLFVLPTTEVPAATRAMLDSRGCGLLACSDFAAWIPAKGIAAKQRAEDVLASFRGRFLYDTTPPPPLSVREPIAVYGARAFAFTHDAAAGRALAEDEYDKLIAERDSFDAFVDGSGVSRTARHRTSKGKIEDGELTAPEFEMLVRYVQRRAKSEGPCVPVRLGVTDQSPDAARKIFIRMRKKVDIHLGGQNYRLFKQRRRFEGGGSEYAFEPDADVRFCVLVPPAA